MINRWLTAAGCFRQADVRAVVCYRQYTWLSWLEKNSSRLKPLCLSSSITYWICWLVPKSVPVLNGLLNAKYLLTMYRASPYPEVTVWPKIFMVRDIQHVSASLQGTKGRPTLGIMIRRSWNPMVSDNQWATI